MSNVDTPTAGWVEFEGTRLLIGDDPTLVVRELDGDEELRYLLEWKANGPDRKAVEPVLDGAVAEKAWKAVVEIGRSSKCRVVFEGMHWGHSWERLDNRPDVWAERAANADVSADSLESAQWMDDSLLRCSLPEREGGWLASHRWRIGREGLVEEIDRLGWTTEGREVDRSYLSAVPILSVDPGTEGTSRVYVVGEGICEPVGRPGSLEEARAFRGAVLSALAGGEPPVETTEIAR